MDAHEHEIVECIRQGQRAIGEAVSLLMKQYKQQIYRYCFFTLKDASQAQKIAEQTFQKVPSALLDYLDYKGESLLVLLEKIATNLCCAHKPALSFQPDPDDDNQADGLSERDRVVLYLRKQGLKWREVAKILGITPDAARKRGERAENRLEELKKHG